MKKAMISGGSSGIGRSIAKRFFEAGYTTTIADSKPPSTACSYYFACDLRQSSAPDQLFDYTLRQSGVPDVLVLNAGQGIHEKLTEGNPELWEQIFQLNVFSVLRLIRAFVPSMLQQGSGEVVVVSSVAARQAFPYGGIYGASKAALDMIAETLRLEVQPAIRVITLHAGVVASDFFTHMIHGMQTPESIGWGALTPEQVADAVWYAVNQPQGVALNDMVLRPAAQPL